MPFRHAPWAAALLVAAGCAAGRTAPPETPAAAHVEEDDDVAFASTYAPVPSRPTFIRNATVMTAAGPTLQGASILLRDGRIVSVGTDLQAPADATVVDGTGKWVTPGLVDAHSHLGVYPAPGDESLSDGNEMTDPNTAGVWAEHSVWPQDPQFPLAIAGGVTTLHVLPGSANLFGGRGVTLRNLPARTYQAMKFPGAPHTLKMACGENPKRVYGGRGRAPATRMGNVRGYRQAWARAVDYKTRWDRWVEQGASPADRPARDFELETLMGVLNGEILVQNHCYRADEMATMLDIADEFGYRIAAFHHGVEAYKVRDLLAANDVCAALWSDWWGFKLEAYDGIIANIPLVHEAGGCAVLHTDSPDGIQRMNQDAAKALRAGWDAGIDVDRDDAITWITINPAKAIGLDDEIGTLQPGKRADVVVWSGDPFSVYSKAEKVWLDGALVYDRGTGIRPITDFELGIVPAEVRR